MKAKKIKLLVTAKTYPTLSNNYTETVCTAGIIEDGSLIRIYPISYRNLPTKERFKKYQWISCEVIKDLRDPRIDSYKLCSNIRPLGIIPTKNNWLDRKGLVLNNVKYNLKEIISEAYSNDKKSLFMFKPSQIIKFTAIKIDELNKLEHINKKREMLLHRLDSNPSLVDDIPYTISQMKLDM